MKSRLIGILPLVALLSLSGCATYGSGPSEIEKSFYKECNPTPAVAPCGRH